MSEKEPNIELNESKEKLLELMTKIAAECAGFNVEALLFFWGLLPQGHGDLVITW